MAFPFLFRKLFDHDGKGTKLLRRLLPKASGDAPGAVVIGTGLTVSERGDGSVLVGVAAHTSSNADSVGMATADVFGHARLHDIPEVTGAGVAATPTCVRKAYNDAWAAFVARLHTLLGTQWFYASSGTWEVPYTGTYDIECVGPGGYGGQGGYHKFSTENNTGRREYDAMASGGGGGGGGSGQYTIKENLSLNKGTVVNFVINDNSTAFGGYLSAAKGYDGGKGGNASAKAGSVSYIDGYPHYSTPTATGGARGAGGSRYNAGSPGAPGKIYVASNPVQAVEYAPAPAGGEGGASAIGWYGHGGRGGNGGKAFGNYQTEYSINDDASGRNVGLNARRSTGCIRITLKTISGI